VFYVGPLLTKKSSV